jgi:hypothetical protein
MNTKKWIWQHKNFPNFTHDYSKIEPMIFQLIEKMSCLAMNEHDNFSVETSLL